MAGKRATAMDYESMTTTMEADPLNLSQIEKARRTVVRQAIKQHPQDQQAASRRARETMLMLGIHPTQEHELVPTLPPNVLPNSQ